MPVAVTAKLATAPAAAAIPNVRTASMRAAAEALNRAADKAGPGKAAVDALGFDHRFRRMWDFYLAYCEGGFRAGCLDVRHVTLATA